ncbi:MAG: response regulator, partial [Nitrospirae bacterium]
RTQVDLLYRNLPLGILGALLVSTVLALVLLNHTPLWGLGIWYVSLQTISLIRYLTYRYWKKNPRGRDTDWFRRYFYIGGFLAGIAWSSIVVLAYPDAMLYRVFIILVIGGMVVGAASAYSARTGAFLSYGIPAFLPLIIRSLIEGGAIGTATFFILALFFALVTIISRHIYSTVLKSIILGYEKDSLLQKLIEEKDRAEELNTELSREVERREVAERELLEHKRRLEKTVRERTADLEEANRKLKEELQYREKMESELLRIQRLESLAAMAGGLAHKYNNLLTAIIGNISLIQMLYPDNKELLERLSVVEKASLEAKALSHKLLNISKGGVPFKHPVNMLDLIRDTVSLTLEGSPVRMDFNTTCEDLIMEVDENQIKQTIQAIVQNSKEAMPEGGTLKVFCETLTLEDRSEIPLPGGEYARITISDHGFGIKPEEIDRIFDPFFSGKDVGKGLGLSAAYSIVRRHKGYITVSSEVNRGTTFHIYLPYESPSGETAPAVHPENERPLRVLVMDDEDVVRDFAVSALRELGCETAEARNSLEAERLYREAYESGNPFDLVILDLTVPGGHGGLEAMGLLKKIDPGVRAVVSSGYSDDMTIKNYREFGFSGVLPKPYRLADLRRLLSTVAK